MAHHLIDTLPGSPLAYELIGSGPKVLFIQGVGVPGSGWGLQSESLKDEFTCLSFDNPGVAGSSSIPPPASVEEMTQMTLDLLSQLDWKEMHIVGHSLGGLIALELAKRAPEKVKSLSLLCTFGRGKEGISLAPSMIWTGVRSFIGPRKFRRRAFVELVMPPSALIDADLWAGRLSPYFGRDLADQPKVSFKQLSAMRRYDATPGLSRLAIIPTLVVSARHDRIAPPKYGERLAQLIPGARFVLLDDAAHGAPIHRASEVNELLRSHLKEFSR